MFVINNHDAIKGRGGSPYDDDDDFEIVSCVNCGCQYLYNSEVLQLYYDPEDLRMRYLAVEGEDLPSCRQCGTPDFEFLELNPDDKSKVQSGPWAWALSE